MDISSQPSRSGEAFVERRGDVPAVQGDDVWVGQRVADGSGNVLDCDLGAEVRKKIVGGGIPPTELCL